MTPEEDAALDGLAWDFPGGAFSLAWEGELIPAAVLLDATAAAGRVAAITISPGLGDLWAAYDAWNESGGIWLPGGGWDLASGSAVANPVLNRRMNQAIVEAEGYATVSTRQGVIPAWSDTQGLPSGVNYEVEFCDLWNVKTWRVAGQVNGFSFDETIAAGTLRRFNPDPVAGDYDSAPLSRSAYGFHFAFEDRDPDEGPVFDFGSIRVTYGLRSTTRPSDLSAEYNHEPSTMILMPSLQIRALDGDGGALVDAQYSSGDAGTYGDPAQDVDVTLCGQALWTRRKGGIDVQIAITPLSYWTTEDLWRGVEG